MILFPRRSIPCDFPIALNQLVDMSLDFRFLRFDVCVFCRREGHSGVPLARGAADAADAPDRRHTGRWEGLARSRGTGAGGAKSARSRYSGAARISRAFRRRADRRTLSRGLYGRRRRGRGPSLWGRRQHYSWLKHSLFIHCAIFNLWNYWTRYFLLSSVLFLNCTLASAHLKSRLAHVFATRHLLEKIVLFKSYWWRHLYNRE